MPSRIRQAAALGVATTGAALTANALRPASTTNALSTPAFLAGLPVSEMPLLAMSAEALALRAALGRNGWRSPAGLAALALAGASTAGCIALERSAWQAAEVLEAALLEGLGPGYRKQIEDAGLAPEELRIPARRALLPAWIARRRHLAAADIPYGPAGKRNLLDVWRRPDLPPGGRAPVIIQVPGGAWVSGDKRFQAYPLMSALARAGWVCVPISYRLSPRATWPDHIIDVKRAIAWVKDNIADYGGDPGFVAITGGSAGGHLSALAALTPNLAAWQPGFEGSDTSVQAAVPLYGVYDLTDWDGRGGPRSSIEFMARVVLKKPLAEDPELWRHASPVHWAGPDAPPMMLVHGRNDSLVPVEGARRLAERLRQASGNPVVYAELPLAQHAFDLPASVRTLHTVAAVERFLAFVRAAAGG